MMRDRSGYLWLGTERGVSRFDGERFVNYGVSDGLPSADILDMVEASDGTYWIATQSGVASSNEIMTRGGALGSRGTRLFSAHRLGSSRLSNDVGTVHVDRRGDVWAGSRGGLFRWNESRGVFDAVPLPSRLPDTGLRVTYLAEDADGRLWIATSQGLATRYPDGRIEWVALVGEPGIFQVAIDHGGRIWVAGVFGVMLFRHSDRESGRGALNLHAVSRSCIGPDEVVQWPSGASDACVFTRALASTPPRGLTLLTMSDGAVIAGGVGWILHVEPQGRSRWYGPAHGLLASYFILSFAEDVAGNVWFGTVAHGATRWHRSGAVTYPPSFEGSPATQLFVGPDQGVYGVAGYHLIYRFSEGRSETIRPNLPRSLSPELGMRYLNVTVDAFGDWWIPTPAGLYRFARPEPVTALETALPVAVYGREDGLEKVDIRRLVADSRGDLWIMYGSTTCDCVTRWDSASQRFRTYGEADGLPPGSSPANFVETRDGAIWVGLLEGFARFRGERFERVDRPGKTVGRAVPMFLDSRGQLWARAESSALVTVVDPSSAVPRLVVRDSRDGVDGPIFSVAEDANGLIYLSSSVGLDRLDQETGVVEHFRAEHGLPSSAIYDLTSAPDGAIWIANGHGLTRFETRPSARSPEPEIRITGLEAGGQVQALPALGTTAWGPIRLRPGQGNIRITWSAIDFEVGRRSQFRYRLQDQDPWSQPRTERSLVLANLAPGTYQFELEPVVDGEPAPHRRVHVAFRLQAPLWRRGWFRALLGVGGMLLLLTMHRLRVSRLVAVERVRTGVAADLHDDLGSNLAQISMLSEVARNQMRASSDLVDSTLDRLGEVARDSIDAGNDIIWAIDPKHDDLGSLVRRLRRFAAEQLGESGIEWAVIATGPYEGRHLTALERRHLWLMFKETLHNAARHGQPAQVKVEITVDGGRLRWSVEDDGLGFDLTAVGSGNGLANLRQRARQLGGELRIESQPGRGTRVVFDLK